MYLAELLRFDLENCVRVVTGYPECRSWLYLSTSQAIGPADHSTYDASSFCRRAGDGAGRPAVARRRGQDDRDE